VVVAAIVVVAAVVFDPISVILTFYNTKPPQYLLFLAQQTERWTCDQPMLDSNPTRGKSCVTTLGNLFTPMCLCHQAVQLGAGLGAVMLYGWEGNCRPGEK